MCTGEQTGQATAGQKGTGAQAAWLSYPEAQRFSGLGRTKLWQLISTGEVKAAKVGRAVRISRRSLGEYMEANSYPDSKK